MEFEFDPAKSAQNATKHGIDFVKAQALWSGSVLEIPVRSEGEPRWAVIGVLDGKCWTAIITRRGSAVRIISVRRSRDEEEELYKEQETIDFDQEL